MPFGPELDPAPESFRNRFTGQGLNHLDEIVLAWRLGGHPIVWADASATFQVHIVSGPALLFRLHTPCEDIPARIEVDAATAVQEGVPEGMVRPLWEELARIGRVVENLHAPLTVSLGKFSRGDRKVFLAYALTIARQIARPPED